MDEIIEQIKQKLKEENKETLHDLLLTYHPYDLAQAFAHLDIEEQEQIKQILNPSELSLIFSYLDVEDSLPILEHFNEQDSANIISHMDPDDATDLFQALEEEDQNKVFHHLNQEAASDIKELTRYQESMAGSIMTNHYFSISNSMLAKDAMKKLVKESSEQEVIDVLFVTDLSHHLKGILSLQDLIIASKEEPIQKIMKKNYKFIQANDSIYKAASLIKEYHLNVLPVLRKKELVGIITIDDVIDYIDDETTEDYDKLAGLSGKNTNEFLSMFRSRLPWLCILLLLSFLVSTILGFFEDIIAIATSLVFFQSLVLDMGGNAGTQSLATTIVSLSKNELDQKKEIHRHLQKEWMTGFINGSLLGISSFVVTLIFMSIKHTQDPKIMISLIVALSMMCAITLSNFIGSFIPIVLQKIHIDPAVASGPFITTLNDMFGVALYYTLAYLILVLGGVIS